MEQSRAAEVLETIFWTCVIEDGFYSLCRKEGFLFSKLWPSSLSVTKKLQEFEALAETKSPNFAQIKFADQCPADILERPLPKDIATIKILHEEARLAILGLELGRTILASPNTALEAVQEFLAAKSPGSSVRFRSLGELITNFVTENENIIKTGKALVGIKNWDRLSKMIGGFNPGRVSIITAGTGVGKTNLAINLSKSACIDGDMKACFVNMEMSEYDIATRYTAAISGLIRDELLKESYITKLSERDFLSRINDKADSIFVTSGKGLTLREIESWVSEMNRKHGIDLVFVDYDQKIQTEGKDEEWKLLQKACETLEEMAKREDLHVVLLSQADTEKDGIPRASRRMMQSASTVLFFDSTDGQEFTIKAIKNRHGERAKELIVNYDPARSLLTEHGFRDPLMAPKRGL